jgi:hypothetical protein
MNYLLVSSLIIDIKAQLDLVCAELESEASFCSLRPGAFSSVNSASHHIELLFITLFVCVVFIILIFGMFLLFVGMKLNAVSWLSITR